MKQIIMKSDEEWKKVLSAEQYFILREKGTEQPFSGKLLLNNKKGIYCCSGCGAELFTDEMKFESHCGWPSFDREIEGGKIKQIPDNSHGMRRIEIVCAQCNGHLGHIFNDGPTDTGERYCVNSISLEFVPDDDIVEDHSIKDNNTDTITFGGGCYWCIESVFQQLEGVNQVKSGFTGGQMKNPTYEQVCKGNTGHAEVVKIDFDPKIITAEELIQIFFMVHDPTTLNRQGNDIGTQYRSVIFYRNEEQKGIAKHVIEELNINKFFKHDVVTELSPIAPFYPAPDFHNNYFNLNSDQPYCKIVIQPKLIKFREMYKDKLKTKIKA